MNSIHKKRLYTLIFFVLSVSVAMTLILYALKQNINVFYTPSELAKKNIVDNYPLRLGGLVKKHSIEKSASGLAVKFIISDLKTDIPVYYTGILPDLFRENAGVIVDGVMQNHNFIASSVLAKHDETYQPPQLKKITYD